MFFRCSTPRLTRWQWHAAQRLSTAGRRWRRRRHLILPCWPRRWCMAASSPAAVASAAGPISMLAPVSSHPRVGGDALAHSGQDGVVRTVRIHALEGRHGRCSGLQRTGLL